MFPRTRDRIFVKPLPPFLLNYNSYKQYISSDTTLHLSALGLLHSYQKLIQHHIDFTIAQEYGLIPPDITWCAWNRFRADLQLSITKPYQINKRYHYGELRLDRLNTIYRIYRGQWRRGYFLSHTKYRSFFRANFEWLILAFAYLSIVLSALQVLLAADQDQGEGVLRWVSIVVGASSTLSVVVVLFFMAGLLAMLKLSNEKYAKSKKIVDNGLNLRISDTSVSHA